MRNGIKNNPREKLNEIKWTKDLTKYLDEHIKTRKDIYFAFYDINKIVENIVSILYLKNKKLSYHFYKKLNFDIKEFKPNIINELTYLMEKPNSDRFIKNKIKIIKKVIKKLE